MELLFISSPTAIQKQPRRRVATCPLRMNTDSKGFAAPQKKPERKPSKGEIRRSAASDRYDEMAAAGMPEYTVWMRLKEVPDAPPGENEEPEEMPWLPVGCISVPRSSQVSKALFDAEEDLMKGAAKLYPNLQKQPRDNIEFGYQLRQFDDEEIRIAERESEKGLQAMFRNAFRSILNPMNTGKCCRGIACDCFVRKSMLEPTVKILLPTEDVKRIYVTFSMATL